MTPVLSTVAAASARGFGMFGGVFGNLFGWGSNSGGQLGVNDTTDKTTLTSIGTLKTWVSCSSERDSTSHAIQSNGTLWSWGSNNLGQLGVNNRTNYSSPVQVGTDTNWWKLTRNADAFLLALKTNNTLWTCGNNSDGQDGQNASTFFTYRSSPVQIGGSWNKISAFESSVACINTSGQLFTWGDNFNGILGINNTAKQSSPVQVGSATNWTHCEIGLFHCIGIRGGALFTWGFNAWGELGQGTADLSTGDTRSSPVQLGASTNWVYASAGGATSFAINSSGQLFAWGYNGSGELGIGTNDFKSSPVQVGSDTNWQFVSGQNSFTFGIKTNGDLFAWGSINLGGVTTVNSPVQIGSFAKWKDLTTNANAGYKLILR